MCKFYQDVIETSTGVSLRLLLDVDTIDRHLNILAKAEVLKLIFADGITQTQ